MGGSVSIPQVPGARRRLKGNILAAQGRHKESCATLEAALARAEEYANPTQLWHTNLALGDAYRGAGREDEALAQYRAARDLVQGIAAGLTDEKLRQGFLGAEPIRDVFSRAEKC